MNEMIIHPEYAADVLDFFHGTNIFGKVEDEADPAPDPMPELILNSQLAQFTKGANTTSVSTDWLSVPTSDVDEGDELDAVPTIVKAVPAPSVAPPVIAKAMTFEQKLGIVKTTIHEVDGVRQQRGFNDKGELVHFRILLPETPDTED